MMDDKALIYNMSVDTGLHQKHVIDIIRRAPASYKVFHIEKRSGGYREIAQPSKDVKLIQRWLIEKILEAKLPIDDATTAYKKGSSIKVNAEKHKNSNHLVKIDFTNFFPSITILDITSHLNKFLGCYLDETAVNIVSRLCSWKKSRGNYVLCIGAPTSPIISNSILYEFDKKISHLCAQENAVYTRYADDITISSESHGVVNKYLRIITDVLANLEYPRIKINNKKTIFASRSGRRFITGITLTPTHEISIGRDRKRLIRAMYHRYLSGNLGEDEQKKMFGLISFAEDIEPGFSCRLKKKDDV
jgi:RNA-directed DNA polymerase